MARYYWRCTSCGHSGSRSKNQFNIFDFSSSIPDECPKCGGNVIHTDADGEEDTTYRVSKDDNSDD